MYRLDWVEQLKLRSTALPSTRLMVRVSPAVWRLGLTSLLTDISSEMVNGMLPVYLVLHLHASPLAYGVVDGIYHGVAVALLSLGGGVLADRSRRHKQVALAGYGLSAICKLALLAGTAWGWIAAVTAVDRMGKGARVAARDSILSLNSAPETMATSFAVHRALDAGGALLGPVVAFGLISLLPGSYDALWATSFVFALLGLSVLYLFIDNPPLAPRTMAAALPVRAAVGRLWRADLRATALAGGTLAAATVSDGFVYLLLQRQSGTSPQFFPLYYVITAGIYVALSVPVGRLADRLGRPWVLLSGYCALLGVYALLFGGRPAHGLPVAPLLLLGLYYAATEGVLMAMASAAIPPELRTTGLALLSTLIGLAKMVSSVAFGWLWKTHGDGAAIGVFGLALVLALTVSAWRFRRADHERLSQS